MTDHARSDKRYPSTQSLQVRCPSWAHFAQLYATDVSQGGMFIKTDTALPLLSELEIELSLPEGHTIQLRARVVHVIDADLAAKDRRPAGMGVQFTNLDGPRKKQIKQLIEFSRWEGPTENRTSLAARLFEMSVSVPPSEVMQALLLTDSSRPGLERTPKRGESRPGGVVATLPLPWVGEGPDNGQTAASTTGSRSGKTPAQVAPSSAVVAETQTSPRPPDQAKLKLGMTHLAHKHFEQAIKTFAEIVQESGGSKDARQWLLLSHARACLNGDDEQGAADHYQMVLELDEHNHEARKFVREHHTKKRLESLPFGRYFVKKG